MALKNERFWPVEVKWAAQIHANELKQLSKYAKSIVLTKKKEKGMLDRFPTIPVPLALLELESLCDQ